MADVFTKCDAEKLLRSKTIWFFGDSNTRGLYKDLLWLLEKNTLIDLNCLRGKLEGSFMNDRLIKGGTLHRGRNYQEVRQYKNFKLQTNIEFTFLTQCCSKEFQEKLKTVHNKKDSPNVVVINSCLWDITRWGPDSVSKYKSNIFSLLNLLKSSLAPSTKVIWVTTPPISNEPRGGFFIKQIEFLKHTLRFEVMEANTFVSREFSLRGFDVLDVHFHLLLQIHRRRPDGIHWSPEAMRHITNLFLTHLCVSWNLPLPGNFRSPLLEKLYGPSSVAKQQRAALSSPAAETATPVEEKRKVMASLHPQTTGRGKKRNREGRFIGENSWKMDFTKDVFDYDYKQKRFKLGRRRNR